MKSSNQIRFDFEQAKHRADELDEIAENMRRLSTGDMKTAMDELAVGWKGESARLFQTKAGNLQAEITSTARDLNNIANTIRSIARTIYEAEMEAWRIANQRQYGGGNGGGGGFRE